MSFLALETKKNFMLLSKSCIQYYITVEIRMSSLYGLNSINIIINLQTNFIVQDGINERIRNVLNNCWEKRDSKGGIADPQGQTGEANGNCYILSKVQQIFKTQI
jgi:hypothetical protein